MLIMLNIKIIPKIMPVIGLVIFIFVGVFFFALDSKLGTLGMVKTIRNASIKTKKSILNPKNELSPASKLNPFNPNMPL